MYVPDEKKSLERNALDAFLQSKGIRLMMENDQILFLQKMVIRLELNIFGQIPS